MDAKVPPHRDPHADSAARGDANIAQVKGRSGLAWFLGSLIGGPIATFLLAVMDRKPTASAPAA